jgi:hypothetical protein
MQNALLIALVLAGAGASVTIVVTIVRMAQRKASRARLKKGQKRRPNSGLTDLGGKGLD